MKVSRQVEGLLYKYFNYKYMDDIPIDLFKTYMAKLSTFPLHLIKVTELVEKQGYAIISEPLLVYNKEEQTARLTSRPEKNEQIINKLSFEPRSYDSVLAGCEASHFVTSGLVHTYEHKSYKAYVNILIVAKDVDILHEVKKKYRNLI